MIRLQDLAFGASWGVLANALSVIMKLITIPILARLLEPSEFGVVAVSMTVLVLFSFIGGKGGLSAALISDKAPSDLKWSSALFCNLILGFFFAGILYYSSNDIAKLLGIDKAAYVLSIIAVLLPIQFCNDIFVSRLSKEKKFKEEAKAIAFAELFSVIFAITLAYMGFGVWALIAQHFVANIIRFVFFFMMLNGWVLSFKLTEIKGLMRFSVVSFFIELFNFVSINAPLLILSRALGVSYSGDYSVKNRLASLPGDVIQQALSRVMFPYIADSSCKDSIHKTLHWSTKLNSLFLMPCFVGLAIISQLATEVLLGKEFMKYWVILCLVSISKAIVSPFSGINSYLKGIGKIESLLILYIFRTVLVTSLGIIFVDLFGYVGIGYAILLTAVFTVFINLFLAKTYSGLTILNLCTPIFKPLLASLTMAFITYIAANTIDYFAILDLMICAVLGLLIYLVSLLLLIPELRKFRTVNDLKKFLLDTH